MRRRVRSAERYLVCLLLECEGEEHIHTINCYERGPHGETPEEMGWVTVAEAAAARKEAERMFDDILKKYAMEPTR